MQINKLIAEKYNDFDSACIIQESTWQLEVTPVKFIPLTTSTQEKKIPKKRGRKPKYLKEQLETSSAVSVQESVASCDLMMLAEIAVTVKEEKGVNISSKFGKLPVGTNYYFEVWTIRDPSLSILHR